MKLRTFPCWIVKRIEPVGYLASPAGEFLRSWQTKGWGSFLRKPMWFDTKKKAQSYVRGDWNYRGKPVRVVVLPAERDGNYHLCGVHDPAFAGERKIGGGDTYELLEAGISGEVAIRCMVCGFNSYSGKDVKDKYCRHCEKFHGWREDVAREGKTANE